MSTARDKRQKERGKARGPRRGQKPEMEFDGRTRDYYAKNKPVGERDGGKFRREYHASAEVKHPEVLVAHMTCGSKAKIRQRLR